MRHHILTHSNTHILGHTLTYPSPKQADDTPRQQIIGRLRERSAQVQILKQYFASVCTCESLHVFALVVYKYSVCVICTLWR